MTYGGTLVALTVPDREGRPADVVLGFESLEAYLERHPYLGVLIGRYANRIGGAAFTLDGIEHALARNEGANHLHGGPQGFHRKLWEAAAEQGGDEPRLVLTCRSPDGEEGYPGNLLAAVTYSLGASETGGELRIDYRATTDRNTVINLTHHAYFNLAGRGDVLDHVLRIDADRFLPVTPQRLPTGERRPVRGTPMDFTRPRAIGSRIAEVDEQLRIGGGYDHNWILNRPGNGCELAAEIHDPASGRLLSILTTQPGLQFYSGNVLDGSLTGKGGVAYGKHAGFCVETQHFPDSPNQPSFPSTVLSPGQEYAHTTIFRFGAR